jgi:hypothetical protein
MHTEAWLDKVRIWSARAWLAGRMELYRSLKRAEAELEYTLSFDGYR